MAQLHWCKNPYFFCEKLIFGWFCDWWSAWNSISEGEASLLSITDNFNVSIPYSFPFAQPLWWRSDHKLFSNSTFHSILSPLTPLREQCQRWTQSDQRLQPLIKKKAKILWTHSWNESKLHRVMMMKNQQERRPSIKLIKQPQQKWVFLSKRVCTVFQTCDNAILITLIYFIFNLFDFSLTAKWSFWDHKFHVQNGKISCPCPSLSNGTLRNAHLSISWELL